MPTYANTSLKHLYENFGDIWIKRETGDAVVGECSYSVLVLFTERAGDEKFEFINLLYSTLDGLLHEKFLDALLN